MKFRKFKYELLTNLLSLAVAMGVAYYLTNYQWFETGEVLIIGLNFYFLTKIYLHMTIQEGDKKEEWK